MAQDIPTTDQYGFPAVPCDRCCGTGSLEHFGHVDAGRCFKCNGAKVVVVSRKAKAAKAAFLAARVQVKTVADLEVGQTFSTGGMNCVTKWQKFIGIEEEKSELNRSNGYITLVGSKGRIGTKLDFPVRIYVPTDVADFLKGL